MQENKLKHLEFIQNVIARMNSNSFLLKGWCVTLLSALFVLAAKDSNSSYILISYIAIPLFWILDGYYLSQERQYRALYNEVRLKNDIDFDMNTSEYCIQDRTWIAGIKSETILTFYGTSMILVLIVLISIRV